MEEKIKHLKKIIIILAVIISFLLIYIFGNAIYQQIDKNTYNIKVTDIYRPNLNFYSIIKVDITCKKDQTIKVSDFTFKMEDGNYRVINSLTYNGTTYQQNESFVVYAYKENKVTIPKSEDSNLYYKFSEIKTLQSKNFR